jgi:hypothetical protein
VLGPAARGSTILAGVHRWLAYRETLDFAVILKKADVHLARNPVKHSEVSAPFSVFVLQVRVLVRMAMVIVLVTMAMAAVLVTVAMLFECMVMVDALSRMVRASSLAAFVLLRLVMYTAGCSLLRVFFHSWQPLSSGEIHQQ